MKFTDAVDMYLAVVVVAVAAWAAADVRHARKLGVLRHSGRRGERTMNDVALLGRSTRNNRPAGERRMTDPRHMLATAIREAPWFDQDTPGETADRCLAALSEAGLVIVSREDLRATLNELDMLCDGPGDDEPNTARLRAVLEGGENAVIRDEWPKPAKDPCYDRNGSRYCTRPKGHEGDHRWDYEPEGCPVLEGGENER